MYGTVRATGYGYSLWEFAVFAGGTDQPAIATTAATAAAVTSPPPPGNWTTVWNDDFTGTANTGVNTGNWLYDTGTAYAGGPANWGTGEVETMTNSTNNVSLDGSGHLDITAPQLAAAPGPRAASRRSAPTSPHRPAACCRSAASSSSPTRPTRSATAPAFRTLGAGYRGNQSTWPGVGETRHHGGRQRPQPGRRRPCTAAPRRTAPCNEYNGRTSGLLTCQGCQTGFHTYSEIIDRTTTDESIRFYLDNDQIWVVHESQVGVAAWQAAVDHGFFLMLDLGDRRLLPERGLRLHVADGRPRRPAAP